MDQNLTYDIFQINSGFENFTISFSQVLSDIIFTPQSNFSLFLFIPDMSDMFGRNKSYLCKYFGFRISLYLTQDVY